MATATFLHTHLRPPAQESRRQELDELIKALDLDDFLQSSDRFNALHPALKDLIGEVEGFKQTRTIPPEETLARWRDMGKELGSKGQDDLSQALTHATEIYGHLREIQGSGDIMGATMGLLGSLQGGFGRCRSNGGFMGGLYQHLNALSMQISMVFAALSHQIEAANQRNIKEHLTTRYNLELMGLEIGTHLKTLGRSSREQGATMIYSMHNFEDKLSALGQNTSHMLDALAMDPLHECFASIQSHQQRSREHVDPKQLITQLEILERWLTRLPISDKLNGTFYANQPGSEQIPFLRGVSPDSAHLVGHLAESVKIPNLQNLTHLPLMEAILEGYKAAQGQLIECKEVYDAEGRLMKTMRERLAVLEGVVGTLKKREVFAPFFKEQQELLKKACEQETKALQAASKSLMDPIYTHVQRNLETTFLHAIDQTFDKQPLNPGLTKPVPNDCNIDPEGNFCMNVYNPQLQDHSVIDTLNGALERSKEELLKPSPLPKMELGKEMDFVNRIAPSFLHHAILKSPHPGAYLREVLLPLQNLYTRSLPLRQALALEQMGYGSVQIQAELMDMEVKRVRHRAIDLFPVTDFEAPFTLKLKFLYLPSQPAHAKGNILLQEDVLSLPSVGTDPVRAVYHSWCWGCKPWTMIDDSTNYAWNGDALGCAIFARFVDAVKKKPVSSNAHNGAVIQTKFNEALQRRQEEMKSHMTVEATASKALLDQAKADYSLAVAKTEAYAHWLGDQAPFFQTADAFFNTQAARRAPTLYSGPMAATINPLEDKILALRNAITIAEFDLKQKRAQIVHVEDEPVLSQAEEIKQLKAQVAAQAKQMQDMMALVLKQQKTIMQMQAKE